MKRLSFISIEISGDGTLLLKWDKQISEDGESWESVGPHRTSVARFGDIDEQISRVNADVNARGYRDGVAQNDIDKIKAHASTAWADKNT